MENVLEKMERIDGKRKIADFIVKQKMDYGFKVKYATIRAREFVRECDMRDLNSIKITVSSSATANKWWYSLNGGSSWVAFNSSSGASKETTVTGLSPNTSYTVQACARKSYNGVDGYSGKTTVKTLGGSVLSSVSTLTADNATAKITLSATVYDTSYKHKLVLKDGGTTVLTLTELSLSNGSNTITLTASQRSSILADMAAKKSFTGTFELSTFSGSSQIGSTSTKTATVQTTAANSAPTFSGFTYKDTNTTAAGVTGNNQILIQSVSTLQITASAATAKNGATISSYSVSAGGSTASSTTVTLNVGKIYTSGTVPIIVTTIDSRGYTSSATVNITVIAYESIDITTAIMRRVNEVEDVTQVTLEGDITPVKVNNVNKNTLRKLYYQYKRTDASAYSSLTDITSFATFNDSGFTFTSDEWLSLDANYSWYVRFYVYDNLTDDTATITVSQGTPLISFRRKKVGINKREPTQALDVDGNIAANGVIVLGYAGHVEGDFNNYKNGGIFFAPTTSGISNAPPGGAGYLEVLSATDGFNLIQRYTATAAAARFIYGRLSLIQTGLPGRRNKQGGNNMQLTHSIALDFGRDTLPITIFAKQYDKESRFVEIVPLECGKDYTLESGVTARLQLTKPDGHTVLKTATIANGVIKVELTEQTLAVAGTAVAEIGLYKGNSLLSSQIFYIEIKRAAYNPDAPASSDEYPALIDALGKVETSVGSANSAAAAANTAAGAANSAATAANEAAEAAEGAENVNISVTQTTTGADITVTNREGEQTTVHIDTLTAVNTWEDIKNAVRLGLGEKLFPVGYEFTTLDADTTQNIIWVVRAHDHHTAANNKLTHTMTLETKNVYSLSSGAQKAVQYDATEAFYYAEQELAAGTYNITIANQAWYTADNGKTFQFTLATAVPAGGQLVFAMTYNATLEGKSVKSYANKTTTTALETVTLTEGSEGTSLGTTNGSSPNVNHMHRAIFGSNNYAQSAVRQWLNSAAVAGSVWTPTNVFDRPASWATSYNGFMHGLPADFLAVVQPAVLACRTNSLFEVESLDGTAFAINQLYSLKVDKFFLLSRPEIFGNWDSESYKDGTQLEYYNGLTATERIKRDVAGTARVAWLRSPSPSYANYARIVVSSGRVYDSGAYVGNGVAPACIIA